MRHFPMEPAPSIFKSEAIEIIAGDYEGLAGTHVMLYRRKAGRLELDMVVGIENTSHTMLNIGARQALPAASVEITGLRLSE
jgi:hypothetical protein